MTSSNVVGAEEVEPLSEVLTPAVVRELVASAGVDVELS